MIEVHETQESICLYMAMTLQDSGSLIGAHFRAIALTWPDRNRIHLSKRLCGKRSDTAPDGQYILTKHLAMRHISGRLVEQVKLMFKNAFLLLGHDHNEFGDKYLCYQKNSGRSVFLSIENIIYDNRKFRRESMVYLLNCHRLDPLILFVVLTC